MPSPCAGLLGGSSVARLVAIWRTGKALVATMIFTSPDTSFDSPRAAGGNAVAVIEKPVARETLLAALMRLGLDPSASPRARVLVADDDPTMIEILAIYLERGGYAVLRARGGAQAVATARRENPEALLLDLMMPDMDGFAVLAALRADPATAALPVLILTGLTLTAEQTRRLGDSAGGIFAKSGAGEAPVAPADGEAPFRELVESSRDWVWQINDLGIFSYCSPGVERLLGYRSDELLGRTRFELMPATEAVRVARIFARCASSRVAVELVESENRRKDGSRVFLETSAVPYSDAAGNYLGYRGIDRDVTARRLAEDRLRVSERQVRELSSHLERVREEEKAAIAREIHDELGGTLAAIGVDVHWLAERLPADAAMQARLADTVGLVAGAVKTLRRIITELRPTILDDLGLFAAIEWQAGEFRRRTGLDCRLGIACESEPNGHAAVVLFRAVQESLTNIIRHAGAKRVDIELWSAGDALVLEVTDDGGGIAPGAIDRPGAHGLRGMRERVRHLGGTLVVEPAEKGGTLLRVTLPGMAERAP